MSAARCNSLPRSSARVDGRSAPRGGRYGAAEHWVDGDREALRASRTEATSWRWRSARHGAAVHDVPTGPRRRRASCTAQDDQRCPIGQGEELFAALVRSGKAEVELVRYTWVSHRLCGDGTSQRDYQPPARQLHRAAHGCALQPPMTCATPPRPPRHSGAFTRIVGMRQRTARPLGIHRRTGSGPRRSDVVDGCRVLPRSGAYRIAHAARWLREPGPVMRFPARKRAAAHARLEAQKLRCRLNPQRTQRRTERRRGGVTWLSI